MIQSLYAFQDVALENKEIESDVRAFAEIKFPPDIVQFPTASIIRCRYGFDNLVNDRITGSFISVLPFYIDSAKNFL